MEITDELLQTIRKRLEQVFFAKTSQKLALFKLSFHHENFFV